MSERMAGEPWTWSRRCSDYADGNYIEVFKAGDRAGHGEPLFIIGFRHLSISQAEELADRICRWSRTHGRLLAAVTELRWADKTAPQAQLAALIAEASEPKTQPPATSPELGSQSWTWTEMDYGFKIERHGGSTFFFYITRSEGGKAQSPLSTRHTLEAVVKELGK